MWHHWRRRALSLALMSGAARTAAAQIDYRNLDDGRPGRVTDAYPLERYGFEFSIPVRISSGLAAVGPHLEFGAGRNLMIGIGAESEIGTGGRLLAGGEAGLLWNVRRETPSLPALSVRLDYQLRRDGGNGSGSAGLVGTRTFGRFRGHLNGSVRFAGRDLTDGNEAPRWWAGVAIDRSWIRSSTLVAAEVTLEKPGRLVPEVWHAGIGLRRQVAPTVVLFAGLRAALHDGAPVEVVAGWAHPFGLAGLMRGGR